MTDRAYRTWYPPKARRQFGEIFACVDARNRPAALARVPDLCSRIGARYYALGEMKRRTGREALSREVRRESSLQLRDLYTIVYKLEKQPTRVC